MHELIQRLYATGSLEQDELKRLIENISGYEEDLFAHARMRQREHYGTAIYMRGLVEFTNICQCDCYYCGIRRSNAKAQRYRLDKEQILAACEMGYAQGYRTFVLQGGEDPWFTDERICDIVSNLKKRYPDCAVTLSIGEKKRESYQAYYDAGAERYLLRHETASKHLYEKLHPPGQTMENRMRCLSDLKEIGYQVGAGMMLEAPFQTLDDILMDLAYLKRLEPDMIGMGPFIHHQDTPFKDYPSGSLEFALVMIAVCRLMFPRALIPATTALGSIDPQGREKGILAGANVVMPNLSPAAVKGKYKLYDNKMSIDALAKTGGLNLDGTLGKMGYHTQVSRGDRTGFYERGK